jgi:hypothetical protein
MNLLGAKKTVKKLKTYFMAIHPLLWCKMVLESVIFAETKNAAMHPPTPVG